MSRKAAPGDVTHEYVEERLSSYMDGQLSEAERALVRKHLQGCQRCQASLDSIGWAVNLLKQVPAPPLPRQFTLPVPAPSRAPAPWFKWGVATASALAAFGLIFLVTVEILSRGAGSTELAAPAAAPPAHTLVAAVAPTSAPAAQDRSVQPTALPLPTQPNPAPAVNTAAPAPTITAPLPRPTLGVKTAQVQTQIQPAAPTEETVTEVLKSAPSEPPCQGCGGGIGGGPTEEPPAMSMLAAATPAPVTATVKYESVVVHSHPSVQSDRVGQVSRGDEVEVLDRDETGQWLQIIFPPANDQGLTGWVDAQSVTLPIPTNSISTSEPPTETPTPTPTETPSFTPTPTYTSTPTPTSTP